PSRILSAAANAPVDNPGLWKTCSAAEAGVVGQGDVGFLQLLDVDVLEHHYPDIFDKPGRSIHVPHPGVVHLDLEIPLAVRVAHVQVDLVGQVEPALRLHYVGELADDVAVLPVELQLHLGLVLLEILCAHRFSPSMASSSPTDGDGRGRSPAPPPTLP